MLSRLKASMHLAQPLKPIFSSNNYRNLVKQNLTQSRSSGHNAMNIEPSNYGWKHVKDMLHFYLLIAAIPLSVISTIINIRANPELTEIPEGYEPRHWEYYKHPIARWMAKHVYTPMEIEHELQMALLEQISETQIIAKIEKTVDRVMRFHSDSRNRYFRPFYGEYFRIARDTLDESKTTIMSNENIYYDAAFDPKINPVPIQGYKPVD